MAKSQIPLTFWHEKRGSSVRPYLKRMRLRRLHTRRILRQELLTAASHNKVNIPGADALIPRALKEVAWIFEISFKPKPRPGIELNVDRPIADSSTLLIAASPKRIWR